MIAHADSPPTIEAGPDAVRAASVFHFGELRIGPSAAPGRLSTGAVSQRARTRVNRSPAAQGPVHRDRSRRCRTRRVRQHRRNQALRQAGRDIAARLHSRRPISGWSSPAPTTGRPPWASASSSVGTSSRRGGRDRAGGRGRRRLIPLAAKDMREGPASLAHTMANRWPRTRPTRKGRSKRGRLPSDVRQEMRHGR